MRNNSPRYILTLIIFCFTLLIGCFSYPSTETVELVPLTAEQQSEISIADYSEADSITFLVIGDMGTGGINQKAVADAMVAYCNLPTNSCDFVTALGDNIYRNGIDSPDDQQLLTKFEEPYSDLGRIDFWMTPGNHDWRMANSVQSEIEYTLQSDRWRMPHHHYQVPKLPEWLNLYSIDTTTLRHYAWQKDDVKLNKIVEEMLTTTHTELCDQPGWRILFGHHPVYSSGKHAINEDPVGITTSIKQELAGLLTGCDIQVYMAGHDHHQELIQADGLTQIIQGAGGRYLRELPRSEELVGKRWSAVRFGFAVITATPDQLLISYFSVNSFGGAWEELCSWTLKTNGKLQSESAECELK